MSTLFLFAPFSVVFLAVLVAFAVDHFLGEPPLRWHPVVWMGKALERCTPWVLTSSNALAVDAKDWKTFTRGAFVWLVLASFFVIASWGFHLAIQQAPFWLVPLLLGFVLKPLLAWRMLFSEVQAVEAALQISLAAGRERLAWLVSRDVTELSADQVRQSAMESLAENLNDSVVAPIFWFLLLGLPGAALYRFANTADAMWGYKGVYKGRRWEWAGKWAARADDVLSWLPARLTALALAVAAGGLSLKQLRREAVLTPSPNSGWPMAAMALAVGVCLHKPGVYALNKSGRATQSADTNAALRLGNFALFWFVVVAFFVLTALFLIANYSVVAAQFGSVL